MTTTVLADTLELPVSKRLLSNRLIKAALTESLADPNTSQPNDHHFTLYQKWSQGGCAMILSGNVMVDRQHRESPRNVVLDTNSDLQDFRDWADAIHSCPNNNSNNNNGDQQKPLAIMQISHPGRQCPMACTHLEVTPVSASSAQHARLVLPGALGHVAGALFLRPTARALQTEELPAIVQRYATTAKLAEEAGWDGVEIHAAHGYLVSQFLSPSANKRTDEYGGSAEGRKKLLLQVVAAVREATSSTFVVGIKVNSKDKATEGKEREEECLNLIRDLVALEQLDFIELSGGGFEDAIFVKKDTNDDDGTSSAGGSGSFFSAFAKRVQQEVKMTDKSPKIILTGGFRTKSGMETAISQKTCDMIGLGRPIIANPLFSKELLATNNNDVQSTCSTLGVPVFKDLLDAALNSLWYQRQLYRISVGQDPDPNLSYLYTLAVTFFRAYIWDFGFHGHAAYKASMSSKVDKGE